MITFFLHQIDIAKKYEKGKHSEKLMLNEFIAKSMLQRFHLTQLDIHRFSNKINILKSRGGNFKCITWGSIKMRNRFLIDFTCRSSKFPLSKYAIFTLKLE
jgi:hypothetical protein